MIEDYDDRHLRFEGAFNFRDIGGYPATGGKTVQWGRYYRAGRQDRMTDDDLHRLQRLRVRTQIDLRKNDEISIQGRGPLEQMGASHVHVPVIPDGGTDELARLVGDTGISGRRYLGYLSFGGDTWRKLFEIFAEADNSPIVIHCTAGKDRTGVSTAFLLSVLGVDRALIEADYLLTNRDVVRQVDYLEATGELPEGIDRQAMMHHAGVPESAMGDFLDGLEDRWGGALGYLRSIGLDEATFAAVRRNFLSG